MINRNQFSFTSLETQYNEDPVEDGRYIKPINIEENRKIVPLKKTFTEKILTNKHILRIPQTRLTSRIWGYMVSLYLPYIVRLIIFHIWAYVFSAKLEEAEKDDIGEYRSIQEFFTRKLKPGLRPIDYNPRSLVSPVDGKIVNICDLNNENMTLKQIKNIDYDVKDFLGFYPELINKNNKIVACVIYLSPGDYHRFHSPYDIKFSTRTHFSGELLPVNNFIVNSIPSLFTINERVCLFGKWKHGFFSYTAVGATNVGSIKINIDSKIKTNSWFSSFRGNDTKIYKKRRKVEKGEELGMFRLGSTIVLVFESPKHIKWNKCINQKIKVGETLAII